MEVKNFVDSDEDYEIKCLLHKFSNTKTWVFLCLKKLLVAFKARLQFCVVYKQIVLRWLICKEKENVDKKTRKY